MENRFYYDGIFYDNEEEFIKAAKRFSESKITAESSERILHHMCKEIIKNIFYCKMEIPITNSELKDICDEFVVEFINKYREKIN